MEPCPASGAGSDVPHGLEKSLDQVGRSGVWTLGETSLHTHHDGVSLPAVLLLEDIEVHPVPPPVLGCGSEHLRDGLVNTGQDLSVARGHTLRPCILHLGFGTNVPASLFDANYGVTGNNGDTQESDISKRTRRGDDLALKVGGSETGR